MNIHNYGLTHSDQSRLAIEVVGCRRWVSAVPQQRLVVLGGDLNLDDCAYLSREDPRLCQAQQREARRDQAVPRYWQQLLGCFMQ
eukprot:6130195-Pyramimonas_sp.AAC.1